MASIHAIIARITLSIYYKFCLNQSLIFYSHIDVAARDGDMPFHPLSRKLGELSLGCRPASNGSAWLFHDGQAETFCKFS
ncbi:hypothetical protein A6U92_10010 [Agrobacterium rubi]|nr:hypothetical protein A6U92_10010 [Agrobacterium rubi]